MSWTALELPDLIPADNADSCHSSADASHREAVLRDGFLVPGDWSTGAPLQHFAYDAAADRSAGIGTRPFRRCVLPMCRRRPDVSDAFRRASRQRMTDVSAISSATRPYGQNPPIHQRGLRVVALRARCAAEATSQAGKMSIQPAKAATKTAAMSKAIVQPTRSLERRDSGRVPRCCAVVIRSRARAASLDEPAYASSMRCRAMFPHQASKPGTLMMPSKPRTA
jgi:hypothetical protein